MTIMTTKVNPKKEAEEKKVSKPVGIGAKASKEVKKTEPQKEAPVQQTKDIEKKEAKPIEKKTAKLPAPKPVSKTTPKTAAVKPSFKAPSAPPPTTASTRIGKLKDAVKRAMTDSIEDEVLASEPEKEETVVEKTEPTTTYLPPTMVKKAPLPPKKPVQPLASGKLSLSDALQASQQTTQSAPLFDAAKFLKK